MPHGQEDPRTRRALAALLSGALLAVGGPAGWLVLHERGLEEYGAGTARALTAPPGHEAEPGPDADPGTAPALRLPAVRTSSARLVDVAPPVDPPTAVRLGGAVAPVDPVGLDEDRLVVVPEDVRRAGWYAPGVAPGSARGSAVLVGHVDDREQGLGTFARLRGLAAGDEVVVETASGTALTYEVVSLEQFPKAEVPMARLFAADGPHRLVLVSCAGDFDRASRSYTGNVVVTAVPRT